MEPGREIESRAEKVVGMIRLVLEALVRKRIPVVKNLGRAMILMRKALILDQMDRNCTDHPARKRSK